MTLLALAALQKTCDAFRPSIQTLIRPCLGSFWSSPCLWICQQHLHILACSELLTHNNISASAIANHLSLVKAKFTLYLLDDLNPSQIKEKKFYNKTHSFNRPFKCALQKITDIDIHIYIEGKCDNMQMGITLK